MPPRVIAASPTTTGSGVAIGAHVESASSASHANRASVNAQSAAGSVQNSDNSAVHEGHELLADEHSSVSDREAASAKSQIANCECGEQAQRVLNAEQPEVMNGEKVKNSSTPLQGVIDTAFSEAVGSFILSSFVDFGSLEGLCSGRSRQHGRESLGATTKRYAPFLACSSHDPEFCVLNLMLLQQSQTVRDLVIRFLLMLLQDTWQISRQKRTSEQLVYSPFEKQSDIVCCQ
jgi:hypothetical protein